MANNITEVEFLQVLDEKGNEIPWKSKKTNSLKLADSFKRLGMYTIQEKVLNCGSVLVFKVYSDNSKKLMKAYFCQNRLCPMCNWRRSNALKREIETIVKTSKSQYEITNQGYKMDFIFLTMNCKNVEGIALSDQITHLMKSFQRLTQLADVKKIAIGTVRVLEITRNKNTRSKSFGTYHPHFHVLIGVDDSYFKGKDYISQSKWIKLWRQSLRVDYDPGVNIQKVKPKRKDQTIESAVVETAKYTVKDTDYIVDSHKETDEAVATLSDALRNRRLIAYGGLFMIVKKLLKLNDSDVVASSDEEDENGLEEVGMILAKWDFGYKNYVVKNLPRNKEGQ
jgi:plasmid rolling circle replication initiator protein Rep